MGKQECQTSEQTESLSDLAKLYQAVLQKMGGQEKVSKDKGLPKTIKRVSVLKKVIDEKNLLGLSLITQKENGDYVGSYEINLTETGEIWSAIFKPHQGLNDWLEENPKEVASIVRQVIELI